MKLLDFFVCHECLGGNETTKQYCTNDERRLLLANLFLHYAFDVWMKKHYPNNAYERYADDIIVHCKTEAETIAVKNAIEQRLQDGYTHLL